MHKHTYTHIYMYTHSRILIQLCKYLNDLLAMGGIKEFINNTSV